jgi:hypothetical protein
MVPAGLTIPALFTNATLVVTEFQGLILLVVGLSIGIWAVNFVIGQVRRARA